jgi:hypothetical protein
MSFQEGPRVTAADFVRHFGQWRQSSHQQPVFVTHHGRDTHVLLEAEQFASFAQHAPDLVEHEPFGIRDVLERVSQAAVLCDDALRVRYANHTALALAHRLGGLSADVALWTLFPDFLGTLAQTYIERVLANHEPYSVDLPSPLRSGGWLRLDAFPIHEGIGFILSDITEDVERNRLGDWRVAMLNTLKHHDGIGWAQLSLRGCIAGIGGTFGKIIALPEDRIIGASILDLVARPQRVAFREALEQVFELGEVAALKTAFLTNVGTILPASVTLGQVRGPYRQEGAIVLVTPEQ